MDKYLRAVKHLSPNRFVFVALAAFFLLYIFIFLDRGNMLCINSPVRLPGFYSTNGSTSQLPVSLDSPNVSGVLVIYNFEGTINSVSGGNLRLSSRGSYLPDFKITSFTPIFWGEEAVAKPARASDLKVGTQVKISANYIVASREWVVNRITISSAASKK